MQRCQNKGDVVSSTPLCLAQGHFGSAQEGNWHYLSTLHTNWSVLVLIWSISQVWSLQPELLPCLKYTYEHKNT